MLGLAPDASEYRIPSVFDYTNSDPMAVVLVDTAGSAYSALSSPTATVFIGGSVTINVQWASAQDVNVTNTPNVSVTNTPTVNVATRVSSSVSMRGKEIGTSVVNLDALAAEFGILVKAKSTNTAGVWLGSSADVTSGDNEASTGVELLAGDAVSFEVDNANLLYAISTSSAQQIMVGGS